MVSWGFGGSPDANANIRYGIEDMKLDNISIIEANRDHMIMPVASSNQLPNEQSIIGQDVIIYETRPVMTIYFFTRIPTKQRMLDILQDLQLLRETVNNKIIITKYK